MHLKRTRYFIVLLLVLSVAGLYRVDAQTDDNYRLVGYYLSYDIYEQGYLVTDIPADQLTHLIYGHATISDNGQCQSSDEWADTGFRYPGDRETERMRGNFKQLRLLKENNPDLQILLAIGGWDFSENFSQAASTPELRLRLARSCAAFMREYGFDGIDIDWRYPIAGGAEDTIGREEDGTNLTLLIAEFRAQLDEWAERDEQTYLLTMTAPPFAQLVQDMEIDVLHVDVDWINVTTYGFHGEWSEAASHHAPLFSSSQDPREETVSQFYNVNAAVTAYLDAGVPASKILVGIPFYAQAWSDIQDNNYFGLYEETDSVPLGTRPGGVLYYGDLGPLLASENYVRFFDDEAKAPWLYNPTERVVISYEDAQSIRNKTDYIRALDLGGVMVWELSFDDEEHTLLNEIYRGLNLNAP